MYNSFRNICSTLIAISVVFGIPIVTIMLLIMFVSWDQKNVDNYNKQYPYEIVVIGDGLAKHSYQTHHRVQSYVKNKDGSIDFYDDIDNVSYHVPASAVIIIHH